MSVHAQASQEGIVLQQQKTKTAVYQIRVTGVNNALQADLLDERLLDKQGILSAETDLDTRICTVEVLNVVKPEALRDAVRGSGFNVAKAFDE